MVLFPGHWILISGVNFFGIRAKSVLKLLIGFTAAFANSTRKSDFIWKFTCVETRISLGHAQRAICGSLTLRKSNGSVPCLSVLCAIVAHA